MEILALCVLILIIGVAAGSAGTRKHLQKPRPPVERRRSGTAAYQEYKANLKREEYDGGE